MTHDKMRKIWLIQLREHEFDRKYWCKEDQAGIKNSYMYWWCLEIKFNSTGSGGGGVGVKEGGGVVKGWYIE